ncbi:MBL fold metallo-hydrolase [candidate division WOR-3 bacterium]|uniref:MBL fold metallo-hydrolase n=1 Tax=candidate division WOR-3 bacterium TaxID=2052148 RepID=A0A9D5QCX2_UNCW3|nr:MBL fold metallo-hydrolase [candidate division WOR-3 bacterium]MBD3365128.1 MBL fold metallo-hydrolase [candidate division WOR-3 bacterium]
MLFERIESEGLAHYSYMIGAGTTAVVIDPRRDCGVYVDLVRENGMRITHILETHRNEDYVIGSAELAARTGAQIWHADSELPYAYGKPVKEDQVWKVGAFKIKALSTPGHTPGSMSYLLYDPDGNPWVCFTGDALFAGDAGRIDLMGMDKAEKMAGMLYESIFKKLLPLGDGVIVCPAHGSGSVCGSEIAERTWTTIGLERRYNPKLQYKDKNEFISNVAKELERPPYFRMMEKHNLEGAPILGSLPVPPALSAAEFSDKIKDSFILDTRMELGFGSAHIPYSQSIWKGGLASFAGWFIPYDKPILLVTEDNDPADIVRRLVRIGYDSIAGALAGGMLSWHMSGEPSCSIRTVNVQELCRKLDTGDNTLILDVRGPDEIESRGRIPEALEIHVTLIPERLEEIPKDKKITVFCGSGMRSMIAASFLAKHGYNDLRVVLGGLSGWNSASCPIDLKEKD